MHYDVAIIGGGPGGATTGTLLRKYNPNIRVAIFEREVFPRDHVGESQLPGTSAVLEEMGCWDKVEAANFPIKLGGTYRWGRSAELWDVEFFPSDRFQDEPRPAKYEGQRKATAFQVDRAVYDQILLDHAREMGCEVFEGTRVREVRRDGDRVAELVLSDGTSVTASHYVDASGHTGVLRRAMGVEVDSPTSLQNIAIWDYWQNAEWAVEIGVGGTFIQVLSVGYGWIWFIPLGSTRTSVGLVIPAKYYKESGRRPAELYAKALQEDERLRRLMRNATSEGKLATTKDWNFVSQRQAGENWYLVGESAGFADPILSAGLTMTHVAAKELAYTILEINRGELDAQWLKEEFARRQTTRVRHHIRFADFWYTSNDQMRRDLYEHTTVIAKDAGLDLDPQAAWRWLAQGGFINDDLTTGTGSFSIDALKALGTFLQEVEGEDGLAGKNLFLLNLEGAVRKDRASYTEGRVRRTSAYHRGERVLPVDGAFVVLLNVLQRESRVDRILDRLKAAAREFGGGDAVYQHLMITALQSLEAMVLDGWVEARHSPGVPEVDLRRQYRAIHRTEYAVD